MAARFTTTPDARAARCTPTRAARAAPTGDERPAHQRGLAALASYALALPPLLAAQHAADRLPVSARDPRRRLPPAGWNSDAACARARRRSASSPPVRYRRRDSEQTDADEPQEQLVGFKLAAVFDVSQTEPLPGVEPAPLDPPGEPVSGDSHAHLLGPLEQHAASLGFTVHYEPLEGRAGYCAAREARIVIDSELPANGKVATVVHELAHAHGIDYVRFSRAEAELIVESVACIVCGSVGLDTSGESVPYLAGWNPDQAVERIELLAGTIDETARAIEQAIAGPEPP